MNAHIKTPHNRSIFSRIVQDLKLDIVVVVETWFQLNTSNKLMGKTFGSEFDWFGKERVDQKGSTGSGGIGILIRKATGIVSFIKAYDLFEGMWVKCVCGELSLFICGVYIPPDNPFRGYQDFPKCLEMLEADCLKFRSLGKVIVLGDFNARIGNNESIIQSNSGQSIFSRFVSDQGGTGSPARTRGIQLVNVMNSAGMIIMNGVDSGGGYTFENSIGNSIIDYIILSDNIVMPSNSILSPNLKMEDKSCPVNISNSIPVDSLYVPNSCTIWNDYMYRIGDHFLLSCKLVIPKSLAKIPFQQVGQKLDIIRWVRKDKGNPEFWVPMQHQLAHFLQLWDLDRNSVNTGNVDSLVSNFIQHVNNALHRSLKIRNFLTLEETQWTGIL
jgi:hypothetical protein